MSEGKYVVDSNENKSNDTNNVLDISNTAEPMEGGNMGTTVQRLSCAPSIKEMQARKIREPPRNFEVKSAALDQIIKSSHKRATQIRLDREAQLLTPEADVKRTFSQLPQRQRARNGNKVFAEETFMNEYDEEDEDVADEKDEDSDDDDDDKRGIRAISSEAYLKYQREFFRRFYWQPPFWVRRLFAVTAFLLHTCGMLFLVISMLSIAYGIHSAMLKWVRLLRVSANKMLQTYFDEVPS